MKLRASVFVSEQATIEVDDCGDEKELFTAIANVHEVFGHNVCGLCGKPAIPRVRDNNAKKDVYYEMVCMSCGARLSFGQRREGGALYPKGTREKGGGWAIYRGQQEAADEQPDPAGSFAGKTSAEPPPPRIHVAGESTGRPRTGAQMVARLLAKQDQLVAEGRCKKGDLLAFVQAAGVKVGLHQELARWCTARAFDVAIEASKEFIRRLPARKAVR